MAHDELDPEMNIPSVMRESTTNTTTVSVEDRTVSQMMMNRRMSQTKSSNNDDVHDHQFHRTADDDDYDDDAVVSMEIQNNIKRRKTIYDTTHNNSSNETNHDDNTATTRITITKTDSTASSKLVDNVVRPSSNSYRDVNSSSSSSSRSLIIFSSTLCQKIVSARVAPVYIGIQQIRPEIKKKTTHAIASNGVVDTIRQTQMETPLSPIVYKICNSDGSERRMTAQEKKQAKIQHKLLLKQQQQQQQNRPKQKQDNNCIDTRSMNNEEMNHQICTEQKTNHDDDRYVPLTMNTTTLEEEILNDRDGIPPVMLSPPLAQQIVPILHCGNKTTPTSIRLQFDDELSKQWAQSLLHHSILPAQLLRQQETNIRIMPYHIVPEVWTRLRPKFHIPPATGNTSHTDARVHNNNNNENDDDDPYSTDQNHQDWLWCGRNPIPTSSYIDNDDVANRFAIVQFLHQYTTDPQLHISCGAKFGCDYLLYDGPRHERHAFAGLRIIPPHPQQRFGTGMTTTNKIQPPPNDTNCIVHTSQQSINKNDTDGNNNNNSINNNNNTDHSPFPIHPNAYDLAGYVRCLNTAGKLALLATTVMVPSNNNNNNNGKPSRRKVLLLDLALEKVAITTSRRPKKTIEQRLKNLAKPSKSNK